MERDIARIRILFVVYLLFPFKGFSLPITYMGGSSNVINVTNNTSIDKLNKPNATYVIQGELNLEDIQWKIPSNSTLFFLGGIIKNGVLSLDNTIFQGDVRFSNVSLNGTCANDELQLGWFCDDLKDDYSQNLQGLLEIAKTQAVIKLGSSNYLINHPVKISKAITLEGNSTRSYKDLGEELFGSTLFATEDINILVITARLVVLEGINFIGNSFDFGKNGVRTGSKSLVRFSWTSSCKVCDCNFLKSHIGLELFHSGIATLENNNFALCNVGIMADHSGDCNYINNYFNTCDCKGKVTMEDDNVTELNGIGILFKPGSGNSNIIGGKIEWNNKGIVNTGSSGITILGVQFDYNKSGHVFYYQNVMQYDSGFNGNSIVGCRFLGTPGNQHIYIRYMTTTKLNITGNFFTSSGRGASDNDKKGEVGPARIFSVYERHLDNNYKNTCTISFGSNSHLNMSKLGYAKPQINDKENKGLIRIITPDSSLSTEGNLTVVFSDSIN